MFLVASGAIKLVLNAPDGNELILALRYAGQFADFWSHDLGVGYPLSAITIANSEIQKISIQRFQAQEASSHLRSHQAAALRRDFYDLAACYARFKFLSPIDRLEHLLWELAGVLGEPDSAGRVHMALPLDNFEMASLCGISGSHYKAVRRDLESSGRLKHQGRSVWLRKQRQDSSDSGGSL